MHPNERPPAARHAPHQRCRQRLETTLGAVVVMAAASLPALSAQQELGLGRMWTFEHPPLRYLERAHGFTPGPEWFDALRLASLRIGRGCSASFVSPRGLILTAHHCVREAIGAAQGEGDWLRDGFVAASAEAEARLPGLTARQLVRTTDVTAEVNAGIESSAANGPATEAVRAANRERVLAAANSGPGHQAQLVSLFHGAVWQLHEYRVYDDIRLVCAPHQQMAAFGGDPDNLTFPRHALDFAFVRAWVDGAPADSGAHWFRFGNGPVEGELVFATGSPGGTRRLTTPALLEYLRDVRYPRVCEMLEHRLRILRAFAARDPESERRVGPSIRELANAEKLYRGEHAALRDPALWGRKDAAEAALTQRLESHPELARANVEATVRLAAVAKAKAALEPRLHFQTPGGFPLLIRAVRLVEFAASGNDKHAAIARKLAVPDDPLQQQFLIDHLQRARRWLPADDPVLQAVLDGGSPEAAVARLWRGSRLRDDEFVAALLQQGPDAIHASDDPALVVARILVPATNRNRQENATLDAQEAAALATRARCLFELLGHDVAPEATYSPRFSDGIVRGYDQGGTRVPWRTVFHGLYARHAEFDGKPPFDLPAPWLLARDRIDVQAAVDFVCTVDSTGGNSGSPIVNRSLELVGLLFDGNLPSLANEFVFGVDAARTVCVHVGAIEQALRQVYGATALLAELRSRR